MSNNGRKSSSSSTERRSTFGSLSTIVGVSTLGGGLLLGSALQCGSTVLSYSMFVGYTGCFAFLLSVAASAIAAEMDAVGAGAKAGVGAAVVFGVNSFVSLLFASIVQAAATGFAARSR